MKSREYLACERRDRASLAKVAGSYRAIHRHALVWLLASVLAGLGTTDLASARPKPASPHRKKALEEKHQKHPIKRPAALDPQVPLTPDLAATREAIELVRRGKAKDATALAASISDPAAAKLVEWGNPWPLR